MSADLAVIPPEAEAVLLPPAMLFSASRIDSWIRCNTYAAWTYFVGYEKPETEATLFGKRVHKVLEDWGHAYLLWLQGRGPYPEIDATTKEGAVAAEILPHIPPEALAANAKLERLFTLEGRHTWQGYKDREVPLAIVIDYKTTSDFKYMKTPERLMWDAQAILYAQESLRCSPEATEVRMRWIYSRTRKPYQARPVEIVMTRAHVDVAFAILESFADDMQMHADLCPPRTDPVAAHKYVLTQVPREETACDDYGGCPHRNRCGISVFRDPNLPPKERTHMSILDRFKAMNAPAQPPPLPAAAHAPALLSAPAAAPMLPPPGPNPLLARLAAEQPEPSAAPPGTPGTFQVHAAGPAASLQPGVYAQPTATAPANDPINPPKRGPGRPRKNADTIPAPPSPAACAAAVEMPPPVAAPVIASAPAAQLAMPALSPAPAAAPAPTPMPQPAAGTKPIQTLFVGCFPIGVSSVAVDQILAMARDMIGPAAYFGGYGYKTDGMMQEAVQRVVNSAPIENLVVMDPFVPEVAKMLPFLRSAAATQVQGVAR